MNIDQMPAGREMDALVAEKVMGRSVSRGPSTEREDTYWEAVPLDDKGGQIVRTMLHYSTDIAAAWEVVEKIRVIDLEKYTALDFPDECFVVVWDRREKYWRAGFHVIDGYDAGWYGPRGEADTAPLAICRAALKAVGCE